MNYYHLRRSTSRILAQLSPALPNLVTALTSLLTYVCVLAVVVFVMSQAQASDPAIMAATQAAVWNFKAHF